MGLELKIGIVGLGVRDNQLGNRIVEEISNQNLQEGTISKLLLNKDTRNPLIEDGDTVNRYIDDYQIKLGRFSDSGKVGYGTLKQIALECDIILFTFGAGISDTNPKTRRGREFNNNVRTLKRICKVIETVFDSSKGYLHIVSNPTDYLVHFAGEFLPNAVFNQIGGHNHVDTFRARDEFRKSLTMDEKSKKLDEKLMNIGEHSGNSFLHIRGFDKNEISQYNDVLKNVYEKMLAKGFDYLDFMGSSNLDTAKTVVDLIKGVNTNELFGISGEFKYGENKVCIGLPRKLVMKNGVIRWEDGKSETGKTEIERILETHTEEMKNVAENFTRRIESTGKMYDVIKEGESAEMNYRWEEVKKVFVLNTVREFCITKAKVEDEKVEVEGLGIAITETKKINGNIVIFEGNGSKLSVITQIWRNEHGVYKLNNHLHRVLFIPNNCATHSSLNLGINEDVDLMSFSEKFPDRLQIAKQGTKKIWTYDSAKSSEQCVERNLNYTIYSMCAFEQKLFIGSDSEIYVLGPDFEILEKIPIGDYKVKSLKFVGSAETNPVIVSKLEKGVESALNIYDLNNQTSVCDAFETGRFFDARIIFQNGFFNLDIFYEKYQRIKQMRFVFNQGCEYVPAKDYPVAHSFPSCLNTDGLKVDGKHIYVVSGNKLLKYYELHNEFKETIVKQMKDNITGFAICEVIE